MTIREATRQMLWEIKAKKIEENNYGHVKDKDIALALNLTAASYSRISTGVTTPHIITWGRLCKMHSLVCGTNKTQEILNKIEY